MQIKNTQIYNTSNYGIIARKGKINGENIVVNNAGKSSLACILGGTYDFLHCTFANFWASSTRQSPTVYLDNTYTQNEVLYVSDLTANFTNSIIYGANNIEIGMNKNDAGSLVHQFKNCLIRFNDINNQFAGNTLYTSIFVASNNNLMSTNVTPFAPNFKNTIKNQLSLLTGSSAIGNGKDFMVLPNDIKNTPRPVSPTKPDIGAYQFP